MGFRYVRYHTEYDTLSRAGTLAVNCEGKVIIGLSVMERIFFWGSAREVLGRRRGNGSNGRK
jgi:hypothetical protein